MKMFFSIGLGGIVLGVCCLLLITGVRIYRIRKGLDFSLPEEVHTVFIGPSTIQAAIADQLLDGAVNLGRSGTNYVALTPALEKILKENSQIDTVYIAHGVFMMMTYSNKDIKKLSLQYVQSSFPFYCLAPWEDYQQIFLKNINYYGTLLNPSWRDFFSGGGYTLVGLNFGHEPSYCNHVHNLYNDEVDWSIAWREKNLLMKEVIVISTRLTILRKIILLIYLISIER